MNRPRTDAILASWLDGILPSSLSTSTQQFLTAGRPQARTARRRRSGSWLQCASIRRWMLFHEPLWDRGRLVRSAYETVAAWKCFSGYSVCGQESPRYCS